MASQGKAIYVSMYFEVLIFLLQTKNMNHVMFNREVVLKSIDYVWANTQSRAPKDSGLV